MAEREEGRRAAPGGADPASWLEDRPRGKVQVDLDRLIRTVPHGVAAAVIDLASGTTLASRTFERRLERDFDLLAAGAADLFHDASFTAVESMDLGLEEAPGGRREAIQKVLIQSHHLFYVFLRCPSRTHLVLATLCRADANLGMVLMVAREALKELEAEG